MTSAVDRRPGRGEGGGTWSGPVRPLLARIQSLELDCTVTGAQPWKVHSHQQPTSSLLCRLGTGSASVLAYGRSVSHPGFLQDNQARFLQDAGVLLHLALALALALTLTAGSLCRPKCLLRLESQQVEQATIVTSDAPCPRRQTAGNEQQLKPRLLRSKVVLEVSLAGPGPRGPPC